MTSPAYPAQAEVPTHRVPHELDNLDKSISVLASTLENLYNRLGPVRSPQPTSAMDKSPTDATQQVADRLSRATNELQALQMGVNQILEELEI